MDHSQKSRAIIGIGLLTMLAGVIILIGWVFNIPGFYRMASVFILPLIPLFLLAILLLMWNTTSLLAEINKQKAEAADLLKLIDAEIGTKVDERSAEFRKGEEKYRLLIEQASDAIYVLDYKGNFIDVNDSMCNMIGYSREELLQLNLRDIIDPEDLKINPVPKDLSQSKVRERLYVHKNGCVFNVDINIKRFPDNRILVIARDITDRKKMESDLSEAELKFRTIADKSMVGIYIIQNGKYTYVNPRFANIFGYEPGELINTVPVETLFDENYRTIALEHIRRRIEGEIESVHYEMVGKMKDHSTNWVEIYGSRMMMDGEPSIIGSMIDITERKEAEELILKEKLLSDTIINSLPGIFYFYNQEGELIRWNENLETVYGYTPDELKTINAKVDLLAEEDRELVGAAIEKTFTHGYATVEARAVTKDGVKIPYLFTGAQIMYEGQLCLLGTGIDISLRVKAEEELRSSEQKYKLLFDSNPMPMWMIAKIDQSIIAANEAAASHYGYTKNELLHMNVSSLQYPEDVKERAGDYQEELNNNSRLRVVRHLKKDGTVISVHIIANDITFEGKQVRLSLTNDITEKLKAERLLKESQANLQTILNTTDTAYALFDTGLNVVSSNQKAVQFARRNSGRSKRSDRFEDYFPAARFPQFINSAIDVLNGHSISFEMDYQQTNGSILWYHVRLFPITNDKKEILGMMVALYDITERKNAEQDLTSAYKQIQNQVNSIKDMAWKQSHLIRSPLANLKALAAMLTDDPSDGVVLDYIQNELDRMDTVIAEMATEASDYDSRKSKRAEG